MEILLNFGEEKNYIFKKNKATEIVQNIENIVSRIKGNVVLAREKGMDINNVDKPFELIKAEIIANCMEEIEKEEKRFEVKNIEIIEMQKQAILEKNPEAKIFAISSVAKKNLDDLLRALLAAVKENQKQQEITAEQIGAKPVEFKTAVISHHESEIPTISLSHHELKKAWQVTQDEKGIYHVTGEKIEKFARRTDLSNYASVNRLRDIMKKLGIRAELTTRGAKADSIIEISGKHFTLVEDY